jgi:hypothetical protein
LHRTEDCGRAAWHESNTSNPHLIELNSFRNLVYGKSCTNGAVGPIQLPPPYTHTYRHGSLALAVQILIVEKLCRLFALALRSFRGVLQELARRSIRLLSMKHAPNLGSEYVPKKSSNYYTKLHLRRNWHSRLKRISRVSITRGELISDFISLESTLRWSVALDVVLSPVPQRLDPFGSACSKSPAPTTRSSEFEGRW